MSVENRDQTRDSVILSSEGQGSPSEVNADLSLSSIAPRAVNSGDITSYSLYKSGDSIHTKLIRIGVATTAFGSGVYGSNFGTIRCEGVSNIAKIGIVRKNKNYDSSKAFEGLEDNIYQTVNSCHYILDHRNFATPWSNGDNYIYFIIQLEDPLKDNFEFKIHAVVNISGSRQILVRRIVRSTAIFTSSEKALYNGSDHVNNTSIYDSKDNKNSLTASKTPTMLRYNYKINNSTLFNQSSSFLFHTLNRIPIITLDGSTLTLNANRTTNNTTAYTVNYTGVRKNPGQSNTKSRYVETGLPTFSGQTGGSNSVYYSQKLVFREIQENLGVSPIRLKKSHFKYFTDEDNAVARPSNTVVDYEDYESDYLFKEESYGKAIASELITDKINAKSKLVTYDYKVVDKRLNKKAILEYMYQYGYSFRYSYLDIYTNNGMTPSLPTLNISISSSDISIGNSMFSGGSLLLSSIPGDNVLDRNYYVILSVRIYNPSTLEFSGGSLACFDDEITNITHDLYICNIRPKETLNVNNESSEFPNSIRINTSSISLYADSARYFDAASIFRNETFNGVDKLTQFGVDVVVIPYKDDDVLDNIIKYKREIKTFPKLTKRYNSAVNRMFYAIKDFDGDMRGSEDGTRGAWATTKLTYRDFRQLFTGVFEPYFGVSVKEVGTYGIDTLMLANDKRLSDIKDIASTYYTDIDTESRRAGLSYLPNSRSTRTLNKLSGSYTSRTLLLADSNKFLVRENDSNIAMFSNWGRYFNNNSYLDIDSLNKVNTKFIGNDYIGLIDDNENKSLEGELKATSIIGDVVPNETKLVEPEYKDLPLTMYISSLYNNLCNVVTQYGYSGGYSSTTTLGRFVMSAEDYNRMMGTPSKDCWWEGLTSFRNTINLNSVTRLEFSRPANRYQIGYFVNGSSTGSYFQVGNNGFFAYVKIFDVTSGTPVLIDDFFSVDQESSVDYTRNNDLSMTTMFPSFINISVYGSEVKFKNRTFSTPRNLRIEYHAQDNDSSINVTVGNSASVDISNYTPVSYSTNGALYNTVASAGYSKHGYYNNWNNSGALGRFVMSPKDFIRLVNAPAVSCIWNGLTSSGSTTNSINLSNVTSLEFIKYASNYNNLGYSYNGGSAVNLPTISGGYVCYIKIVDTDANELLDEFIYTDLPYTGDYTKDKDAIMAEVYPSFENISVYSTEKRFKRMTFGTAKNIKILFAGRSDDNSFTATGYYINSSHHDQYIEGTYEEFGTTYNDSYGVWLNYHSQIAAKYGYPNANANDGLFRFACKFDEYREIASVNVSSKKWKAKDYNTWITSTSLNYNVDNLQTNVSKVTLKTNGSYVEVYLNDNTSTTYRYAISGYGSLLLIKSADGTEVIDDMFILYGSASGNNTTSARDAQMQQEFPNFRTIVDPSIVNTIYVKELPLGNYKIQLAGRTLSSYSRFFEVINKASTAPIGNRAIKNPKNFLPTLTNKALESLMVFSNNKIKTKTIDPTVFEKFYNNVGGIKPPFMNHVMLDLGPSIDTREYFFITDEAGYNSRQRWSTGSTSNPTGSETQSKLYSHVALSHHGFVNIVNLASIEYRLDSEDGSVLTSSTYGDTNTLRNYIEYLPTTYAENGADEIVGSVNGRQVTAFQAFDKMTFGVNVYGPNVVGRENTFKGSESTKVKSALTSKCEFLTGELKSYFETQTKIDGMEKDPYLVGGMQLANGFTAVYPFYGGMIHKVFTNGQIESKNDFSGTFLAPIPILNNPMVNGLNYRLGMNYGMHGGNGLSVLCENQVFSTSNNTTGQTIFNTYNDIYTGWGNGGSYVAQRANMSTTVGLQTNASYCRWSPYKRVLERASSRYKTAKDTKNSSLTGLHKQKDPLDIANASCYINAKNLASETGYANDNMLLPSERWRNIYVTYDSNIEFVGNTIYSHAPDGAGVDTVGKHIMYTKPTALRIVETYPTTTAIRNDMNTSGRYKETNINGMVIDTLSNQVMMSHDGSRILTTASDINQDYATNQANPGSSIEVPKFIQGYTLSHFEIPLYMTNNPRPDNIVKNWLTQKAHISLQYDVNDMFVPNKLLKASGASIVFKSASGQHNVANDYFKRLHKYTIGDASLDRPYSTVILDVINRNNYLEICDSQDFEKEEDEDYSFVTALDDLESEDPYVNYSIKPNRDLNIELISGYYLTNMPNYIMRRI